MTPEEKAEAVLDGLTRVITYRRSGHDVFALWEAVLCEQGVEKLIGRGDSRETALERLHFEMRQAL